MTKTECNWCNGLTAITVVLGVLLSIETIYVETRTVACNGGVGHLGLPRVFLNMGPAAEVTCPYCSRQYVLEKKPAQQAAAAS